MMRVVTRGVVALIAGVALAGCAGGGDLSGTEDVNLRQLVTILPTPQRLTLESSRIIDADAVDVQATFARQANAEAVKVVESSGLKDAAIRTWSGPDGASLTVVASRWPDNQRAANWGAGAVQLELDRSSARAWTPREAPGARGSRTDGETAHASALSLAVGDINVYVRATGPVADADVVETLTRAIAPIRAAVDR